MSLNPRLNQNAVWSWIVHGLRKRCSQHLGNPRTLAIRGAGLHIDLRPSSHLNLKSNETESPVRFCSIQVKDIDFPESSHFL